MTFVLENIMGNCFGKKEKVKNESTRKNGNKKTKTEEKIKHQNSCSAEGIQRNSNLLSISLSLFCHFPKNEIQLGKLLIVVR